MKKLSNICSVAILLCLLFVIIALRVLAADSKPQEAQEMVIVENGINDTSESESDREEVAAKEEINDEIVNDDESEGIFTKRDMDSDPDLSEAKYYTVSDGDEIVIESAGIYVLSGRAEGAVIRVSADKKNDKVQLVLDNLNVTNSNFPVIYIESADKTFITTKAGSENNLSVTGGFISDGDVNTDGVIFSKDDLTLNGEGILNIDSTYNGIVGKDDVKITNGIYNIKCIKDAIEVKDTISICGGEFNIETDKDGINCSNDEEIVCEAYISDGTFNISAGSTGIQVDAAVIIDGGIYHIIASEGIESTFIQINGGYIDIYAYDDAINATMGSSAYDVAIEINGGDIYAEAGPGDTDVLDANGCIYINGGNVYLTGQSATDYDYYGELNGGNVYVNGEQVFELTPSMMGGGKGSRGNKMGW